MMMYYYQFHIGDYLSSTAHLSNEEDLAYRRLLDMYFTTEKAIPLDTQWVARRLRVATQVVETVLQDFFERTADGYTNKWCEQEIERFKALAERNKRNGALGGRPKRNPLGYESDPTGIPDKPSRNPNQQPITNNQEPIEEPNGSLSGSSIPPCPQQEILALWKQKLPHLAQPRVWEGSRAAALRQRWQQAARSEGFGGYSTREGGLEWWESFFEYIATGTSLSKGFETQGRVWRPDLEWVVNATNFAKIVDGKYKL